MVAAIIIVKACNIGLNGDQFISEKIYKSLECLERYWHITFYNFNSMTMRIILMVETPNCSMIGASWIEHFVRSRIWFFFSFFPCLIFGWVFTTRICAISELFIVFDSKKGKNQKKKNQWEENGHRKFICDEQRNAEFRAYYYGYRTKDKKKWNGNKKSFPFGIVHGRNHRK